MTCQGMETFLHLQVHSFRRQLVIVLMCLWVTVVSPQDVGTDNIISCSVPPVKLLQDTVLTCYFPEDLNITNKDFSVYHYVTGVSPDFVLDCWWIKGALECINRPNTTFNKIVNKSLKLTIRQVRSNHTGRYACQVAGYEPRNFKTCDLQTKIDAKITCTVPVVKPLEDTVLTCHFPEDISLSKKGFTVYHYVKDGSPDTILNCWWVNDRLKCVQSPGVEYEVVNSDLKLNFRQVTLNYTGTYSCHLDGHHIETCDFQIQNVILVDHPDNTLAITLGLLVPALSVAAGIVLLLVYRRKIPVFRLLFRNSSAEQDCEESCQMITGPDDADNKETTRRLVNDVKKMYPEILDTCYFVPPVYFNKTQYKTYSILGETIYSPIIPDINNTKDISVVRHDRAMQHVLHCLHHLANEGKEKVFVITQFNYNDYLNNPGTDFQQHRLPVPSGLVDEDEDVACFDFLMVHREHGVLVGVVKAVSDKVEDSKDGQQDEGGCIVTAVTEAVQQLQKANHVIRHVMSDQQHFPTVHQTLILPNLPRASLSRAVAKHQELVERLRECVGGTAIEDPTKQCLCVEDLSDPSTPWVVTSDVVNRIRDRWKWTCARVDDDVVMKEELYLTVIARFCGPATQSTLDLQDEAYLLPKTLAEAVSLTGDLYERWTLHPHMVDILEEKRLFLVGPPSKDKMRMLTLAAKKWLSGGHQVYILSDSSEPRDSVMSTFYKQYTARTHKNEASGSSQSNLSVVQCNLKNKNEVEKTLNKLIIMDRNSLCVIADESVNKRKHFRSFCETLNIRCPDLYFWVTSSTDKIVPDGWTVKTFTRTLTCPPAVVRESLSVAASQVTPDGQHEPTCLPPTDGPPVKYFDHKKSSAVLLHDCRECSKEVADFLFKHLIARNVNPVPTTDASPTTSTDTTLSQLNSTALKRASTLQKRDVLVLFECDMKQEMNQFLVGLNECGIEVSTLQDVNGKYEFKGKEDSVCAMQVSQLKLYTPRKKVVVYVAKHFKFPGDICKKRLVHKTCSSQLIVQRR